MSKFAEHQVAAAGMHTWSLLCLTAGTGICAADAEVFEAEVLELLMQSSSADVLAATSCDLWYC